ncbi:glucokinase family protein [Luteimonas sp. gir]|uniref:glucokinase family protein n=1 Tax=Luteimonas sp. gir TaxID=3127960 RepID=UPI003075B758
MAASPSLPSTAPRHAMRDAFIAADVGGTHVRIGLVEATGDAAHPVRVLEYRKYACAAYPGLVEIVEDFLAALPGRRVDAGAIASAGYALGDGTVITANLPWPISLERIRTQLGFREFRLVNDFEAVAHAAAQVDPQDVVRLTGPDAAAPGPMLIVGPGTGLGAAVRIPTAHGPVVLATEAGQAALTTGHAGEQALLRELQRGRSHVPIEHALSGPGLLNLYRAVCALQGVTPVHTAPGEVTAAAIAGDDAQARAALDAFCGLLGSTIGDMALLYGAHGGIYLAGGILPQIRDYLMGSDFVARFLDKAPMREALERIPVNLVEHGQLGVIGAASWYLDRLD